MTTASILSASILTILDLVHGHRDQMALTVMHKLNGKMMPNTNPPVRWKLNHSSNRLLPAEKNHSVWVGDLTPEVCFKTS